MWEVRNFLDAGQDFPPIDKVFQKHLGKGTRQPRPGGGKKQEKNSAGHCFALRNFI